ncbi:histidine phosphatase family protein [Paenibacillus ginsengarvi]|uniref:Histidine phosphatase family protein n=1 Tax=Paenibacillus ginsengarvi TaxID=400777 RepID=A0A3B0CQ72_9BACL|nr:histidine phosphatase family protein [Paenibacillus ginsengarvi]RKN86117.1 histidine phosphatase family protein [Paenibacillus ginsengarvi]
MAVITFVRHGVTNHNIEKRAQGHTQNPLNEEGRAQAQLVARRLSEEQWDVFLSSDLRRARETADIVAAAIGRPVDEFDPRLREMDRGKIADTTEEERVARWGKNWKQLDMAQETHESMRARGIGFIQDIASRYAGKRVLVVTHGYFLGQTLKELMQDESTGSELRNTSVTTIAHDGEKWGYLLYDCTKHLPDHT